MSQVNEKFLRDAPDSLAASVARAIEQEIVAASLPPGTAIGTKDTLQARFGISRGTLNEAVQLLRARGLVELRPGPKGGIFAARPARFARMGDLLLQLQHDAKLVAHTYAVKDALDPWLASDAAAHRNATDVRELRALLKRMRKAAGDQRAFGSANWALHRRIAEISPNLVLRSIYLTILDVIEDEVVDARGSVDFNRERCTVHERLIDAIASGDRDEAYRAGGEGHRLPLASAPPAR